jgi:hypothetical protein
MCIAELIFGSVPFEAILILGSFWLGMKVLAMYIDPNCMENKFNLNSLYATGLKKCEILILDTHWV